MQHHTPHSAVIRIALACAVAAIWAIGSYFLVEWARPDGGVVSVSFALIQPVAICAFIACVADPFARRPFRFYVLVPFISAFGMIVIAAAVLQEGAICIAMLTPIWLISGLGGTLLAYKLRRRGDAEPDIGETFNAHALLALPLVIMPIEASLPVPQDAYTVTREVVIAAPAQAIWPLMQGMGDIAPGEGRWNISQDLIGLPRPQAAWLEGAGIGAARHGRWEMGVEFSEVVTAWQPHERIGWQFDFTHSKGWDMTDPHLRPDGPHMRITTGQYELVALGSGQYLLRLETDYTAHTHFNGYAALWGELFLGDVQDNILAAIKQRAEGQTGKR